MSLARRIPGTKAWRRHRRYVVCMQTAERLQEIVDGELPPSAATRLLERHVDRCPPCATRAKEIAELKQAIARVGCQTDPAVMARLQDVAQKLCRGEVPPPE